VLPATAFSYQRNGAAHAVVAGVDPEVAEQLKRRQGGGPRLALVAATPTLGGEAGAAGPLAVVTLQVQQAGTPALGADQRPFGRDLGRRGIGQVAQHLPADRRVGVEQPVEHSHRSPT
jgi:hypothetical protein